MTRPTSPVDMALSPTRAATDNPCAKGEPPPHAMVSRRFLAIAIDRDGGKSTSASSPRKGTMDTMSRLWYELSKIESAAPFAPCILFNAIEPEASTRKMTNAPDLRASFFARMSPFST